MFEPTPESYEELELKFNAYHEAGHAVAWLKGKYPSVPNTITVIPDDNRLGYVAGRPNGDEHDEGYTEYRVVCSVSGRTAERILAGLTSGMDGSARDDLKTARGLLRALEPDNRARRAWMKRLVSESKTLIEGNWELVKAVAEALMVEGEMDGSRFLDIVDQVDPEEGANWLTFEQQLAKMAKLKAAFQQRNGAGSADIRGGIVDNP